MQDTMLFKPIHFAAACEDSGPIELLIEKGSNVFDLTIEKQSSLHIAAKAGREKCISALLKTNKAIGKLRDK